MCSAEITKFTFPQYYNSAKSCYVGFFAQDPVTGKMRRKRYKLSHIQGKKARKQYACILINALVEKLLQGWSPWSKEAPITVRYPYLEVFEQYAEFVRQQGEMGALRPSSVKSYLSKLKVLTDWLLWTNKIAYIDEFSRGVCVAFLDFEVIEMKIAPKTRNHYLVWLGTFSRWLYEHEYVRELPTDGIQALRVDKKKNRVLLTSAQLEELREYLIENNKPMLLVCYLIYYCMIRPKELSLLKLEHIRLKDAVIHIPGSISKNRCSANVTLPKKVIHLMLELNIFDKPSGYYIFGKDFLPGRKARPCKAMSDYWEYHIRRDLKWGTELKLYSLKDTGITNLLHHTDALTVRDQARHSDLSITNIYAGRSAEAVQTIVDWDDA